MKKTLFFQNAKLLADAFGIVPLLYGSLGLEYVTDTPQQADDIDILIPEVFLDARWEELLTLLIQNGYHLTDEREHSFAKDGVCYAYASIEELETFVQIKPDEIHREKNNGVCFKVLTAEQYLLVYQTSVRDGYRIHVRQKKDEEKIAFITEYLRQQGKL